MDRKYYTTGEKERQEVQEIMAEARQYIICAMEAAQLIQRKRKIKDYGLLFDALYHYLVKGMSFRKLAGYMNCKYRLKMAVTAWKKQCYKAIPVLRQAAADYLEECSKAVQINEKEVIALDATAFSAQGRPTTVTRVHSAVSLTDGICRYDRITDEHVAESVRNFPINKGALYLADRIYANASQIACILEHGSDVLFRFSPSHIKLYKDAKCEKRLNVDALLTGTAFSVNCYIQDHSKIYPVRIVGMPLPEQAHETAQKKYVTEREKTRHPFRPAHFFMQHGFCC